MNEHQGRVFSDEQLKNVQWIMRFLEDLSSSCGEAKLDELKKRIDVAIEYAKNETTRSQSQSSVAASSSGTLTSLDQSERDVVATKKVVDMPRRNKSSVCLNVIELEVQSIRVPRASPAANATR